MDFDWSDLAFKSKKPLNNLEATFIIAPREISLARFKEIVKTYLQQGNLILGIAKEEYVLGFEDQPQFKMLRPDPLQKTLSLINERSPHKIYTLEYFQRD